MLRKPEPLHRREIIRILATFAATELGGQTAGLTILGIDHVSLSVADADKTIAFYRPIFGQSIHQASGSNGFSLSLGDMSYIAIRKRAELESAVDHFMVAVQEAKADLGLALKRLGIPFREGSPEFGDLNARDPDGTRIQLSQPGNLNPSNNVLLLPKLAPIAGIKPVFHPKGLGHVRIQVSSLLKSTEFYRKLFGSELRRRPDQLVFKIGSATLEIREAANAKPGIDQFSVLVEPYESASASEQLRGLGVEWRTASDPAYFIDPDGIIVQVATAKGA